MWLHSSCFYIKKKKFKCKIPHFCNTVILFTVVNHMPQQLFYWFDEYQQQSYPQNWPFYGLLQWYCCDVFAVRFLQLLILFITLWWFFSYKCYASTFFQSFLLNVKVNLSWGFIILQILFLCTLFFFLYI